MKLELGGAFFSKVDPADLFPTLIPSAKVGLRVRLYLSLLLLDCAAVLGAFAAGDWVRFGAPFGGTGLHTAMAVLSVYLVLAVNRHVYSADMFVRWRNAAVRALSSFAGAVFAILVASFYLRAGEMISREAFTLGAFLSAGLLYAIRFAMDRGGRRLLGGDPFVTLVLKDGVEIDCGPHAIAVDAAALALSPNISDPRALDRVGRLLKRADRVVIACAPERRVAWAAVCKGANIRGEVVTPELDTLGTLGAGGFEGQPTLVVSIGPLSMRNRALKRGLDLFLSVLAMLVLAPLMAITAIAVKLESPGPVFFVQPRLGRGNRLFPMYKFRSMRTELCDVDGATSTARGDKRVTRVGRIIRATSIDELPQILNVLKGDMSIVGPRPHALGSLAGDKLFWEVDQRYWHRHATKPGITGLAQVKGFRGATHLTSDLTSRLQADLDYLNGWTLWRDISILLATFKVVLHKNAY